MKTITVKGVGKTLAKPDFVVLSMSLEITDTDYERAMQGAAQKIAQLNAALASVGFEIDAVKTTDFDVHSRYDSRKDGNGNYHRVFKGYVICHRLKVSFDFDAKVLAQALGTIASCVAQPELSIKFTVKDATAVNEALLKSAAENARRKAEILCVASGATLGELTHIDYNWGELNVYSNTRYDMADDCMREMMAAPSSIEIEPDDIDLSDTVTFTWQIV